MSGDIHDKRRSRNFTVGAILFSLVVLFFLLTIVKLGALGA